MPSHAIKLAVLCLALSACADGPPAIGRVGVAISATASDGEVYRIPSETFLVLSSPTFFDEVSLNPDTVHVEVPVGEYEASLRHAGGYTTRWPLEHRFTDGTFEPVMATLTTPLPTTLLVDEGATVSLVLSFTIANGATITFAHGAIDVTAEVATTTSARADTAWLAQMTTTSVTTFPATPPALEARLPAVGTTGLGITVLGRIEGAWTQVTRFMACAPLELTAIGADGHAGFADLVFESSEFVEVCVGGIEGSRDVRVNMFRLGPATTPTFSDLGATNYLFLTTLVGELPAPAFDGRTLDLSVLDGTHTVPLTALTRVSALSSSPSTPWYRAIHTGTLTLLFTPLE